MASGATWEEDHGKEEAELVPLDSIHSQTKTEKHTTCNKDRTENAAIPNPSAVVFVVGSTRQRPLDTGGETLFLDC